MPDIRRKLCAVGPFSRLSRFAILLAVSSPFASQLAWGQPRQEDRRSYDRRSLAQAAAVTPRSAQTDALTALRQELDGSLIHGLDPVTGVTRSLSNPVGYLTAPRPGDPSDIALDFVRSRATLLGLDAADLAELEVTDAVFSAATGATHVYLRQVHQGLPVFNATLQVHLNREGRISGVQNGFDPTLRLRSVLRRRPSMQRRRFPRQPRISTFRCAASPPLLGSRSVSSRRLRSSLRMFH